MHVNKETFDKFEHTFEHTKRRRRIIFFELKVLQTSFDGHQPIKLKRETYFHHWITSFQIGANFVISKMIQFNKFFRSEYTFYSDLLLRLRYSWLSAVLAASNSKQIIKKIGKKHQKKVCKYKVTQKKPLIKILAKNLLLIQLPVCCVGRLELSAVSGH